MSIASLICKVFGHDWWTIENTVESKREPQTQIGQTFEVYTVNKVLCRRCGTIAGI